MKRILPLALACLMFAIALDLYSNYIVVWVGFPAGNSSELDIAEKELASYFVPFSLAMGFWFCWPSLDAGRNQEAALVRLHTVPSWLRLLQSYSTCTSAPT